MKKYKFPFDKVLKIKTIELDKLVTQLNQIRYEIHLNETKKSELIHQQNQLNEDYLNRINVFLTSLELNQLNYKKESLNYQIKQINQKLNELKRNEMIVLDRVIDKKKEQSTLNKLDEKLFNEYKSVVYKKENAIMDEMLVLKMSQNNE